MLVAGVDSSTQSTKVVLCDADDGTVVAEASAPHPDGTETEPSRWWDALQRAGVGLLDRAGAIGVAAQQHGMVVLDEAGRVIRPALLWNDLRSAPQAAELVTELGGPAAWARRTGSVPTASFTVAKLRWLAEHEPEAAARTAQVLLPHDWLTWQLASAGATATPGASAAGATAAAGGRAGAGATAAAGAFTDRGDASGTGYFSPAAGTWLPDIAAAALGKAVALPRLAAPAEVAGHTKDGIPLSAGTGDNMGAALGLGLQPGEVVVSIGTSGTAYAVSEQPAADETGAVAGFADATGRFLPLVCTVNAARVLSVTANLLNVDIAELSRLALDAPPGAKGITLLPYLDGERTPDRPDASGVLNGLTSRNATPQNLARAAVEAVLCSLADAVDHLGLTPERVLLIGGAARSQAIQQIAPAIFGVPVTVPPPAEYVALGAARQAAWARSGTKIPPDWPRWPATTHTPATRDEATRARYAALRDATAGWHR